MFSNYNAKPTFMAGTSSTFGTTNGNLPQFFGKPNSTGFAPTASTTTFGQPTSTQSMFSPMQPSNVFQATSGTGFNAVPTSTPQFGSNLFGQQPQPSTSGLFTSGTAFGQNKATFGFGATTTQPTLFGQQTQPQTGSSLFQPATSSLFGGSTAFGGQTTQTGTVVKFNPLTGTDTMQKNGVATNINTKHWCISCMKEYENKSLEELRFEDYSSNRKGPQQPAVFSSPPFGAATATTAAPSLFGTPDNKPTGFGQATPFGQTSTFGTQNTTGFGLNANTTQNSFLKPGGFGGLGTSTASTFGFNTGTAAPFSQQTPFGQTQAAKPFAQSSLFSTNTSQPAQTGFGVNPVFGQTNAQQTTTGFGNTGQAGFSFNQPATTQASSNLFQVSKPSTGFGIFGQPTNATTPFGQMGQTTMNTTFGVKPTTNTFGQPTQTGFGSTLGGGLQPQQQTSIFGNPASKPPLFGTSTGLFSNNSFQQPNSTFSTQMTTQQPVQFPPDQYDVKNISLLATDIFGDGYPMSGLVPIISELRSTTNPEELKSLIDNNKKREDITVGSGSKSKVHVPKPKRGPNYNREFFEANEAIRASPRCLVLKKKPADEPSPGIGKYRNELLEEAERVLREANQLPPEEDSEKNKAPSVDVVHEAVGKLSQALKLNTDNYVNTSVDQRPLMDRQRLTLRQKPVRLDFSGAGGDVTSNESEIISSKNASPKSANISLEKSKEDEQEHNSAESVANKTNSPQSVSPTKATHSRDNAYGVILNRPEYYMFPKKEELHQYADENGNCIVQGLTIGRKGYGNVYFSDPINITNMNFDELVHFRHREIIIYPNDDKKPPQGEGLNRRAQVTLDKIFPREKTTGEYITDVDQILSSDFIEKLMLVTKRHRCEYIDYRPKTGSWVFNVKHFSKYGYNTDDEDLCEIDKNNLDAAQNGTNQVVIQGKQEVAQKNPVEVECSVLTELMSNRIERKESTPKYETTIRRQQEMFNSSEEIEDLVAEDRSQFECYLDLTGPTAFSRDIQMCKNVLFGDLNEKKEASSETSQPKKITPNSSQAKPVNVYRVTVTPKVYDVPRLSDAMLPGRFLRKIRAYTEMSLFKGNSFKVGWSSGYTFYQFQLVSDVEMAYTLNECSIEKNSWIGRMMPELETIMNAVWKESSYECDRDGTPLLTLNTSENFLETITSIFEGYRVSENLRGKETYLASVFNLCKALWGRSEYMDRRKPLGDWLTCTTRDFLESSAPLYGGAKQSVENQIFQCLSCHKVREAAELAMENNLNVLAVLISQLGSSEISKNTLKKYVESEHWRTMSDDMKKLYLLLSGTAKKENINICQDMDWIRCLGLFVWYISDASSAYNDPVQMYRESFEAGDAAEPVPPYEDLSNCNKTHDLLFQIIELYANSNGKLTQLLGPASHTENCVDYRLTWLVMQLLLSLRVGLITENEINHIHTTFASQLEEMGEWKWATFVLQFLRDQWGKKDLIMRILMRHLAAGAETREAEYELVHKFRIPPAWIHHVKADKCKLNPYAVFQHSVLSGDFHRACTIFARDIMAQLFTNGQYDDLLELLKPLLPAAGALADWNRQVGLVYDFIRLRECFNAGEFRNDNFNNGLNDVVTRVQDFPVTSDMQRLLVTEIMKSCTFMLKVALSHLSKHYLREEMLNCGGYFVMPPDVGHHELLSTF